jgi:arginyl-tRNA--protein-N-Asp/Glu arginylyltransferase
MERKLFTALQGENAEKLNNSLSKQGFRRSQNVLYRPSCAECSACLSARIKVADFKPTKSQKRVLRKNSNLNRAAISPWATEDQFALFRRYLDTRHADGGMADMDIFEFAAMIEETPIRSRVIEYTSDPSETSPRGKLSAVCLTDVLDDGLSMVYSFFDPDLAPNSMGTYLILDHIAVAREAGLPYVYLGYWVPGSQKMGYKARFSGLEVFRQGAWETMIDKSDYDSEMHPLSVDPIAEQVSKIKLPDSLPTKP